MDIAHCGCDIFHTRTLCHHSPSPDPYPSKKEVVTTLSFRCILGCFLIMRSCFDSLRECFEKNIDNEIECELRQSKYLGSMFFLLPPVGHGWDLRQFFRACYIVMSKALLRYMFCTPSGKAEEFFFSRLERQR